MQCRKRTEPWGSSPVFPDSAGFPDLVGFVFSFYPGMFLIPGVFFVYHFLFVNDHRHTLLRTGVFVYVCVCVWLLIEIVVQLVPW